jgi:hypothetical protein
MLSTLPKLADKTFIIGFFLPTLLFAVASLALFSDFSFVQQLLKAASSREIAGRLVFLLLALWSLSILILITNHHQYQALEGYRWPVCKFDFLKKREKGRFTAAYGRFEKLSHDLEVAGLTYPEDLQHERDQLRRSLVKNFPVNSNFLLPTRFGNAIRAFETYSQKVYGADAIPLWPHLSSVIPREFAASLDDARAQVNFLVNIGYFAGIIALASFVRVLVHGAIVKPPFLDLKTLAFISISVGAACICRMSYIFSLQRVYAWGVLVKAAFDCFLPALAERLGFVLPNSADQQRAFWVDVSQRAIFHLPLRYEWPLSKAPTKEKVKPSGETGKSTESDDKDSENSDDDGNESQSHGTAPPNGG